MSVKLGVVLAEISVLLSEFVEINKYTLQLYKSLLFRRP